VVVECSYCEARVDAKVVASYTEPPERESGIRLKASLLMCPRCENALLATQTDYVEDSSSEWDEPIRVWPNPDREFSWRIPDIVRGSLEEANKCFKAGAYSACAVMCGRALEGICRHFKTKSNYLGGGLKELLDQGIIDGRLFSWSEALHKSRNRGAHASSEKVSKADARDLVEFANAICEYVFVLTEKFNEFVRRQKRDGPRK